MKNKTQKNLVEIINQYKNVISKDELREVNMIYDSYIPGERGTIHNLRRYKNFLASYVKAKFNTEYRKK